MRKSQALAGGIAFAVSASGILCQQAKPLPPDSVPALPWVRSYFPTFDAAARAAGMTPLRQARLDGSRREVRIWTQAALGSPNYLYRFVDSGGVVQGEMILYWRVRKPGRNPFEQSAETTNDFMLRALRDQCEGFNVGHETGTCRARFTREPDWARVLRSAEENGLWTIPDPSALPPDSILVNDGWAIAVELQDGRGYRAYLYETPDAHPKSPSATQVRCVARGLSAIYSLIPPPAERRVWIGALAGAYMRALPHCGD